MSVNNDVQIEKWPCINSFFQQLFDVKTLKTKSETGLSFKCLLCLPKQKIVCASQSSNANLRTHIKVGNYPWLLLLFLHLILRVSLHSTDPCLT